MNEPGAISFDPLYNAQDTDISDLTIMETGWGGDQKFGPDDEAVVQVTFKNFGEEQMISFQFQRASDGSWRIADVHYRTPDDFRLSETLAAALE